MGNSLIAESKLQFYPTQPFETYRLLGVIGRLDVAYYKYPSLKEYIGENIAKEIEIECANKTVSPYYGVYDYLLQKEDYDAIKKFFTLSIGYKSNLPIVVADLFAGEGAWLDTFINFIPNYDGADIVTIANELEKNRFECIKNNRNFTEIYNEAFENLKLPQQSISLMLFNPPYGFDGNERNARRYLKMILERNLLYNNEKDYSKSAYMIFVLRKDDLLDNLDLICQYFEIWNKPYKNILYKVNPSEYAKYKQFIFIAKLKKHPYDINNPINAIDMQNAINTLKEAIDEEPEFDLSNYRTSIYDIPPINYIELKNNFKYIIDDKKYISNNDNVWKWIKGITELKDLSEQNIIMPKPPKTGEISLLIASGVINGKLSIPDGTGEHIVIGGTKKLEKQEEEIKINDKGEKEKIIKTVRYTEPYLNILCSQNGKLMIKELGGNTHVDTVFED